jgi:hypothetical protein
MFTAYYILAPTFGFSCALLSLYAIKFKKDDPEFPGKLYVPIMIIGALFAVSTLAAVIHGGNQEVKQRKAEKAAEASAPAPAAVKVADSN